MSPLPIPREPVRLRARLRQLAGEDPGGSRAEIARRVAEACWRSWRTELAPLGVAPRQIRAQTSAAAYETWLWVMGDRTWESLAEQLAGRVTRRLPPMAREVARSPRPEPFTRSSGAVTTES